MKIPRSFELQGRTIRVVQANTLVAEAWGQWEASKDRITIDPAAPRDLKFQTFLHEFCHAAFEALGRDDLSSDEKLVDGMAGLLHQMLKTSK